MLPIHAYNVIAVAEDDYLEEVRQYNIERRRLRDESNPFEIYEVQFRNLFRLSREMARYVLDAILPRLHQTENPVAVLPILRYVIYYI